MSIVNSVAIYEAKLTWMSLSNQAAFCLSMQQIHVTDLTKIKKSARGIVSPSSETADHADS